MSNQTTKIPNQTIGNISVSVQGDDLVLRFPLNGERYESGSGKSDIVATTNGNQSIIGLKGMKLGVNCYVPK